jgi:hypothetical protein
VIEPPEVSVRFAVAPLICAVEPPVGVQSMLLRSQPAAADSVTE